MKIDDIYLLILPHKKNQRLEIFGLSLRCNLFRSAMKSACSVLGWEEGNGLVIGGFEMGGIETSLKPVQWNENIS
jgi:hypothetical protein